MNQYNVSGILQTYSEKCLHACNTKALQQFVRDLKQELNSKEIKNMKVKEEYNK